MQNPHIGLGPENSSKNLKMAPNMANFVYFFSFFFVFSGPSPGCGIVHVFRFFVFPGLRGFWALYQVRKLATQDCARFHQEEVRNQGESNMHQIVVTVSCRLCPPFLEGEFAVFCTGKRPVSMGSHIISTESPV